MINPIPKRDFFFAIIIGIFSILALVLIYANRGDRRAALAPAFCLGAASSLIAQMWLGGIRREDNNSLKANLGFMVIQLGGGIVVLVGGTWFFHWLLTNYYNHKLVIYPENYYDLSVFNHKGEPIPLKINEGTPPLGYSFKPEPININEIKDICRLGKGFCEEHSKKVKIKVKNNLEHGNAIICDEYFDRLSLMVQNPRIETNIPIQVSAYFMQGFCPPEIASNSEEAPVMWISPKDAETLELNLDNSLSSQLAWIAIVPQKLETPTGGIFTH